MFALIACCADLPEVSVSETRSSYAEGDTVEVECSAEANPPAALLWYRDGSGEIVSRESTLRWVVIQRGQFSFRVSVCRQ